MTLYYSLVFALLSAEIFMFMGLILPMPFRAKRTVFTFLSENPIVAKLNYGLKITWIFVGVLWLDSINRVYRVQTELWAASEANNAAQIAGHERVEILSRKFYSERNMYLCGSTLFLSLILRNTYVLHLENLRIQQRIKQYQGTESDSKQAEKLADAGAPGEIARLKQKLAKKEEELQTLKKQSAGLQKEYFSLSDKVAQQDNTPKKDR